VYAHGIWLARTESGSFEYQSEYEVGDGTVRIISHREIPSRERQ
jgi:hypothetical protein